MNPADADQLVLLHVEAICAKEGILIPWERVAKAVSQTLTGEAIKQHLSKVIKQRVAAGRPVPEKSGGSSRRGVGKQALSEAKGKMGGVDDDEPKEYHLLYYGPGVPGPKKAQNPKTPKKETGTYVDRKRLSGS